MFKLNIHDLAKDSSEIIDKTVKPSFLLENLEKDVAFEDPVKLKINIYRTDKELIFSIQGSTSAIMPCKICNEPVKFILETTGFQHTEPLASIKGSVFNYTDIVREALLLELPLIIECNNNNCPERTNLSSYLKTST